MTYKPTQTQIETAVNNCSRIMVEYCMKWGIHYLVTGSSGGLDSAVTLGIAQKATEIAANDGFKITSVGVTMPCESSADSIELGAKAISRFGAVHMSIDLSQAFRKLYGTSKRMVNVNSIPEVIFPSMDAQVRELLNITGDESAANNLNWSAKVAQGNIKARLRMMVLYHIARMLGSGMVLSTDNLSEHWMGFWTICGDVGDYCPIQLVLKGMELYEIASYLGVPQRIIDAKPDDGLGVASGGDEAQLGASYVTLDEVMISLIQQGFDPNGPMEQLEKLPEVDGVDPSIVHSLARRCLANLHKRRGPIVITRDQLGLPPIMEIEL